MDILSKRFSSNVKDLLQTVMPALSDQALTYNSMVCFVQGIFCNIFVMALQQVSEQ
jgi:formate/nitrite transporter FocA (FNT family)